jgi:poly(3-hydroxybutyrate) depolymerase
MADDARAVLDAADVERAHVYGISLGGMVAQQFALLAVKVFALRGCVLNYRTTLRDMEILLDDLRRVARK